MHSDFFATAFRPAGLCGPTPSRWWHLYGPETMLTTNPHSVPSYTSILVARYVVMTVFFCQSFTRIRFYDLFLISRLFLCEWWQGIHSSAWWKLACSWGTAGGSEDADRTPPSRTSAASTQQAAPGKNMRNIARQTSGLGSSCSLLLIHQWFPNFSSIMTPS